MMFIKSLFKKGLPPLLAFFLPLTILFIVLLAKGISWGSSRTILASDGFHQYVIFAQNLRNILHGSDSLFYTFTSGLGLNFYALMSYYLGSFLSPLVYFFSLQSMPDAIYLFTLIKFGLSGLTMFVTLQSLYSTVKKPLLISLSTAYALMSFAISQLEINTWLDVFIVAPVIILGLHRLLEKRQLSLYYISLSLLFIQNYYFGFMMAIFLTLYTLVQLSRESRLKKIGTQLLDFSITSIFSALSSAIMLLPTYLDLSSHGEKLSSVTSLFVKNTWYFDLFAKTVIGAYDTTKFGSIPMIYVGLLPLVLCLLFFAMPNIRWQTRLAYFLLIGIILASFYLEPLDLLWQGMHAPNMFLHRYSWVLSLLIILMAAESLSHLKTATTKRIILPFMVLFLGFSLTLVFHSRYDFLKIEQFILTFIFLVAYLLILINSQNLALPKGFITSFTLIFTFFEVFLNTYFVIGSLGDEWVFPTRAGYAQHLSTIEHLVNYAKTKENNFFRMERLRPQTGNDSMKFNYNGISQFSSIRNTASSSLLDRLGFQSKGTNLNLRYQNNTLITDSLFAIKYNLSQNSPQKFGFRLEKSLPEMSLYQNAYAAPLAMLSTYIYKDVNLTINTLDNQAAILNQLTGLSLDYFQHIPFELIKGNHPVTGPIRIKADHTGTAKITYRLSIPANQQVYISLPNLTFSDDHQKEVIISHDNFSQSFTTDNAYTFFNIGYFKQAKTINLILAFPQNSSVSFDTPHVYGLNTSYYQTAMTKLNQQPVSTTTKANKVITHYQAKQQASLVYTLPFDKGWKATVNGKKAIIRMVQNGLMAVDVPKGKGQVVLNFLPDGFKLGAFLSLIGVIGFIGYRQLTIIKK